ncbi:MAG: D-arabinono-1,4-lactone oxidase [Verrucomicrobiota bacterium]
MWSNDRHFAIRPWAGVEPGSAEELSRALRRGEERRIKAIGSLHAFAPLPDTEGLVVSLRRMKRVLAVEGTLVTAEGGITIGELNHELARHGLALPTHGSFVAQTLAGAIATGTHGGALALGTLADCVEALEIVRADGERVVVRKQEADFDGAVVSLGLLGVTASVSVRCVPEFYLRAETEVMPFEAFLAQFDALQRENEFTDARWFPQVGVVEVLRMNRVAPPAWAPVVTPVKPASPAHRRMVSSVFKNLLRGIGATGSAKLNASFVRKTIGTTYKARVGRCDELLAFTDLSQGEPFPIDDLEYAVPYGRTAEALRALEAHFRGGGRMPVFFPVHLRCSAAGGQWLCANHGQPVCWLEFWQYPAAPQFYTEIAEVLARFAPRYHLGKILPRSGRGGERELAPLNLPRLAEFRALRERWDPTGALLNSYVGPLLGIEEREFKN